ncbi:MAG TPA: hypothetical protein DIS79_09975 [Bacteroidetes bacterium]|nr:hypothetical protein [Bacteroidota bacterium]HRK05751.1 NAD(P)-dependent oxidoreductase [Chlorobiota bacterium]
MTILIDDLIPGLCDVLGIAGDVVPFSGRMLTNRLLRETGAEALLIRSTSRITAELLEGTNVRFIGSATSGMDHVDVMACLRRGIIVVDAVGSNANAVAEYVVDAILQVSATPSTEIVGVVGYGNVGSRVARYARALGMHVVVNDPPFIEQDGVLAPGLSYAALDDLLAMSSIVTLHVPLTLGGPWPTFGMIGEQRVGLLRPDSLFINTSRGGIVDERALLQAMQHGLRTVVDVFANEPTINAQIAYGALITTPHVAGHTYDAKVEGARSVGGELLRWRGLPTSIDDLLPPLQPPHERILVNGVASAEEVRAALRARRPLTADTSSFVAALHGHADVALAFDAARRAYPLRRETLELVNVD